MTPTLSLSGNLPSWKEALKIRVNYSAKKGAASFISLDGIPEISLDFFGSKFLSSFNVSIGSISLRKSVH